MGGKGKADEVERYVLVVVKGIMTRKFFFFFFFFFNFFFFFFFMFLWLPPA